MATPDAAHAGVRGRGSRPPSSMAMQYHRFRGGERCEECGARQWYAEDALRYCRNGHRLEGFAAHEADEDAFGTQGRVSRRRRHDDHDDAADDHDDYDYDSGQTGESNQDKYVVEGVYEIEGWH